VDVVAGLEEHAIENTKMSEKIVTKTKNNPDRFLLTIISSPLLDLLNLFGFFVFLALAGTLKPGPYIKMCL
jgi:hypothetical protein